MKEEVFKVSDLQTIFESIQRDVDELKETLARIPQDRDYSLPVTTSIQQEIERLEKRRDVLLNLEIRLPIEALERNGKENSKVETLLPETHPTYEPISPKDQSTKKIIRRY